MNHSRCAAAVLALALWLPSAPATACTGPGCGSITIDMSVAMARLSVSAARDKAMTNAKRLGEFPVEFGYVSFWLPYGSEPSAEVGHGAQDVKRTLLKRAEYWKTVGEVLTAEYARLAAELEPGAGVDEGTAAALRELAALSKELSVVDAIKADVAKDQMVVDALLAGTEPAETRQQVLDRKAALYKRLAPAKKAT